MRYPIWFLLSAALPCVAQKCASLNSLNGFPNPTTVINSAVLNAPRAAQGNTPALPEHCEVQGRMNERTGVNAQHYAIRFHLRLPTEWNGKFFFEGGGGSNGNLGNALGNLQGQQRSNALVMGFAVVSTDSGHDNAVNNDPARNGTVTFGFDPQARRDFGYNSYDQVTQAAKAIIRAYYGRAPERSYYVGCSEGGREAMMMSQRFPAYFDGILASSPGFKLAKAALFGHSADVQALAEVAKTAGIFDRFGSLSSIRRSPMRIWIWRPRRSPAHVIRSMVWKTGSLTTFPRALQQPNWLPSRARGRNEIPVFRRRK